MVARGQNREITVSKSTLHSNVSSPFVAEALACLEATRLGIRLGFNSNNKNRFQNIIFRFIQRTENGKAHDLAKEALKKEEGSYLVEETRENLDLGERWPRNPD
ncbi:hypothetical protein Gohar_021731 [Gossypium harknessii]|uniref:RNase H type-1 domain-containing protein n=1 Tax=Gossypium harknessii TaxID=34285 RepID=A0A7J9IAU1_9ROSI|nr:hypothetical protein [Gossypium harknessii]